MKTIWKYWKSEKGVRILKVFADTDSVTVPGEIEGTEVTEISPYCFSASEIPARFRVPDAEVKEYIEESGILVTHGGTPPFSGDRVEGVKLPDSVKYVGDYAFYGCRNLRRLSFSSNLKRTGTGLFVGSASMRYMNYHLLEEGSRALSQMLSELRYHITVTIKDDSKGPSPMANDTEGLSSMAAAKSISRLVFPEYFEMSVENHAARLFDVHIQGMGYRYRQSFVGGKINYKWYDEQLELAITLAPKEVVAELSLERLRFPLELTDEARKAYLDFFSRYAWEAGDWLLNQDDAEAVRMLAEAGAFDGKTDTMPELFLIASRADQNSDAEGTGDFYTQSMGESGFGGYGEKGREEEALAKRGSSEALEVMLELAGRKNKTECVSILMDYRHKKQGAMPKKKKSFDL